jgi:hypothetical protein
VRWFLFHEKQRSREVGKQGSREAGNKGTNQAEMDLFASRREALKRVKMLL